MTKQDILDGLEALKDLVNVNGKVQLDNLKAGVMGLEERVPDPPAVVTVDEALSAWAPEPTPEPKPEPKKPRAKSKPYKRRSK